MSSTGQAPGFSGEQMTSPVALPDYEEQPDALYSSSPLTEAPVGGADSEIELIKSALETRRKMFLVTALEGARAASLEDGELYVEFAPEARHLRDTLAKSDNVKILREICQEITGRELGVRIMVKDQSATVDSAPLSREEEQRLEQSRLRESAEKDPVVQQMLRTFRGEIVDVRRVDKS